MHVVPFDATSGSTTVFFSLKTKGWQWIRRASKSSPSTPVTVIQSYCQIIPELEVTDWKTHREGINAILEFSKRVSEKNATVIADMLRSRNASEEMPTTSP